MKQMHPILRLDRVLLTVGILVLAVSLDIAHAIDVVPTGSGVSYRRKNEGLNPKNPCPTRLSKLTTLQRGDVICTDKNSSAVVKCDKGTPGTVNKRQTEPVSINAICPTNQSSQLTGSQILVGGLDEQIPYIISPRYTLLLTQCPTFRWHGIRGATSYTVMVYKIQRGVKEPAFPPLSQPASGKNVETLQYPCNQKNFALASEIDYKLVVTTDSGLSSEKEEESLDLTQYRSDFRGRVRELRFRLLGGEIAQQRSRQVEIFKQSPLKEYKTKDEKVALLASFYVENNLYAEAIAALEERVEQGSQESATYRMLGDFYARSGLSQLAKRRYEEAIQKATARNNFQEKVTAQEGLKNLCRKVGDKLCK